MIDKLKVAWEWLDQKKTIIGTVAMMGSKVFPENTVAHQVLYGIGYVFGTVGILHKVNKKDYGKLPSGIKLDKLKQILKESLGDKK
jgi:hypothetical protein